MPKCFLKGFLLVFFVMGLNSCAWWQQSQKVSKPALESASEEEWHQPARSIKMLLESVQHLAALKDYEALRQHIYPYEILDFSVQEAMLYGIRTERKSDDFAYSEPALKQLIDHQLYLFQPASEAERAKIIDEFFRADAYQVWRDRQEPAFWLMDYEPPNAPEGYYDVTIVVIQEQGAYRLVFWENLDCLIRCEQPRNN